MALTDLCLRDERPHFCEGTQRTYTLPNGYELSLINFPNAHVFPFAWEGAVINPHGKLDYDTPLTNDVEVFRTEEQTNEWIIRAILWAEAEAEGTVINAPDPFHPDYGLPDVVRLRAVHIAETKGVKAAASECKVALSTVYRWRNAYASSVSSV
ncbi:hypothetical protein UFOVP1064_12 [uncultured Caudovirales phage]|uniref:Homeodomain-like domain containing protein n=1 Tax=uncultured Caudovirales phage TaxID=2100421 RepID=A0A6J5QJA4_9CAUD|nr:hypothetical protein UFOVP659_63 [uncultured Caudovirales phage]CAB4169473.1 hypothetical protein UFOVP885_42 [uncultured Caudovirales phage]CAB4181108.1 hypothetical protein UFOVP1064_12 [uncultured Caudovirales phage]CAB4190307.1 hypothetical protein UFOVP1197_51 [uncultured Caudovirales phage]CAB4195795.1 hypothetical protein UFOVP1294_39 [uncultured Caudovirales phage]